MKTRLLYTAGILALLLIPCTGICQTMKGCEFEYGTWTELSQVPSHIYAHAATSMDGKAYIFGGGYDLLDTFVYNADILEYDPTLDQWGTVGTLPYNRVNLEACTLGDVIYLLQGYYKVLGVDEYSFYFGLETYDPLTNAWKTLANYPENVVFSEVCALDGKLYACGGLETSSQNPVNSMFRYDPEADSWTRLSSMNSTRWGHIMEACDGKIYVFGGSASLSNPAGLQSAEVFDPVSNTWSGLPELPVRLINGSSVTINDEVYIFGGREHSNVSQNRDQILKYKTSTQQYMVEEMGTLPAGRAFMQSIPIGRSIYHFGGMAPHAEQGDFVGINTAWKWKLSDIVPDGEIPSQALDFAGDTKQVDLTPYFHHVYGENMEYSACVLNPGIVSARINGAVLEISGISPGTTHISILVTSGEDTMGSDFSVTTGTVGISADPSGSDRLKIFPNPSGGAVQIHYTMQTGSDISLELYDMVGKRIGTLLSTWNEPGVYEIGKDLSMLAPGFYFIKLISGETHITRSVIIH